MRASGKGPGSLPSAPACQHLTSQGRGCFWHSHPGSGLFQAAACASQFSFTFALPRKAVLLLLPGSPRLDVSVIFPDQKRSSLKKEQGRGMPVIAGRSQGQAPLPGAGAGQQGSLERAEETRPRGARPSPRPQAKHRVTGASSRAAALGVSPPPLPPPPPPPPPPPSPRGSWAGCCWPSPAARLGWGKVSRGPGRPGSAPLRLEGGKPGTGREAAGAGVGASRIQEPAAAGPCPDAGSARGAGPSARPGHPAPGTCPPQPGLPRGASPGAGPPAAAGGDEQGAARAPRLGAFKSGLGRLGWGGSARLHAVTLRGRFQPCFPMVAVTFCFIWTRGGNARARLLLKKNRSGCF